MEYTVKPTGKKAKGELIEFLNSNDFRLDSNGDSLEGDNCIVIDVINRTCFCSACANASSIDEGEFYSQINYVPGEVTYERIVSDDGKLVYEGYASCGYPYGLGRLYFDNGNVYQEGVFDIKGLKMGKEYYCSGQLKFKGTWSINFGYGPNAPSVGEAYHENGELMFSGKFEIKRGGVGYPMIKRPAGYRNIEKNRPDIRYVPWECTSRNKR